MPLSKKQIYSLIIFVILLFALPLAIFLTQKRQDIRPRALQGKANLLISSDKNSANVGESINVLVSLQVTDNTLKVSGVDFMLLYDKDKMDVLNILPALQTTTLGGIFTEAPVVTSGGRFDDTFNFLRVVEIAKMQQNFLPAGTITLARVTFRSIGQGSAIVKFPEDNKYLEIVGTGTYISPTPCPAGGCPSPTPSITPGGPTLTPVPPTVTPTPDILAQGLMGYWKMDEISGSTVSDSSGNGNTGTVKGSTSIVNGKAGKGRKFNSVNDVIEIADSASLNPTKITLAAWVYPNDFDNWNTILSKTTSSGWTDGYGLYRKKDSNKIVFFVNNYDDHTVKNEIDKNKWTFIAATYDESQLKFYVNGVLKDNSSYTGHINHSSNVLNMGSAPGKYYWKGIIDEVRIYNRALSSSEVQKLYDRTK